MSIGLILVAVAVIAVLFRLLSRRFRIARVCTEEHWLGSIRLHHYAKVPCDVALWVNQRAQSLWDELGEDFPEETRDDFILDVICDRNLRVGMKPEYESRAIINLAWFFLDITHPSFEAEERSLRGTIAEELHHLVRSRRFGEEEYEFRPDPEEGHLGTVRYYAVNEFEYEALKFCVRATGDRADLLVEVKEYRSRKSVDSSQ